MMREDSTKVHEKIMDYIKKLEQDKEGEFKDSRKLYSEMKELPEARQDKSVMRSAITKLVYELYGGDSNIDMVPALTVSELNNINAYLDNLVFDNKKDIWSGDNAREKVSSITATSAIFRELTEKAVLDIPTSDENKVKILGALSECMAKSYQGQRLDIELTIDKIDDFKNDDEYLKQYLTKSKLQSGYLYGLSAKIGAILANASDEQIEKAEEIGQTIGTGIHISNDLGDFAVLEGGSTGFKIYQDQLADLKNRRLTFPVYYVLKHGSETDRKALLKIANDKNVTLEDFKEASKAIHTSGAFEFGKKELLRKYHRQAKNLIHESFPESKERDILSAIPGSIISNKYLSVLKESKPKK